MKILTKFYLILLLISGGCIFPALANTSPLAAFSKEWNEVKYQDCNTAASTPYLGNEEKKVIQILNLVRMNPSLFAATVVKQYPASANKLYLQSNRYYKSLLKTLENLQPMGILQPDVKIFTSALCHATSSGIKGYVGHDRLSNECKKNSFYYGECCDYGRDKALDIVMALLIDEDVPSLGHRKICLDPSYKTIGAAIRPHKTYRVNTVIDFGF